MFFLLACVHEQQTHKFIQPYNQVREALTVEGEMFAYQHSQCGIHPAFSCSTA